MGRRGDRDHPSDAFLECRAAEVRDAVLSDNDVRIRS